MPSFSPIKASRDAPFPRGTGPTMPSRPKRTAHLSSPFEAEPAIDRFSKIGCVQGHRRNAAALRPPNRGPHNSGRVALPTMVRLREHGHQIGGRRLHSTGAGLDFHYPNAAASNCRSARLNDETDEMPGPHARAGPSAIDAIRGIEVSLGRIRYRLPHRATMTDEEVEVVRCRLADRRPGHVDKSGDRVNGFPESQP